MYRKSQTFPRPRKQIPFFEVWCYFDGIPIGAYNVPQGSVVVTAEEFGWCLDFGTVNNSEMIQILNTLWASGSFFYGFLKNLTCFDW
jgi:hypothetical protein